VRRFLSNYFDLLLDSPSRDTLARIRGLAVWTGVWLKS